MIKGLQGKVHETSSARRSAPHFLAELMVSASIWAHPLFCFVCRRLDGGGWQVPSFLRLHFSINNNN